MDRRRTGESCRERLTQVFERSGLSRSAFAAKAGLDRSTLSQLLAAANDRLPRAETIAAIAEQEQVSTDWLLGLVQEEKIGTNIRSEEHTSELQSLMRISYAVFCLKKKNKTWTISYKRQ